ncbi:MarR family transcriptional regulator [Sphingobium sp. H39-3-25]|uniref:MarR family winged helix-turn-helix transcriptional regulator n=1 Tax=Sphingobium arseniciresistens TaxID=3030834 RepID=UPI0023B8DFD1|nr:MarR family transcriptional regulator [Sphingobium arseniciresistens]
MIDNPNGSGFVDPVASHLGYLMRRASAVMMAHLGSALAVTELRPVEATIIVLIGANPGCTQSDIGRALGIKRANMVPLIAGLCEKALIERERVDGRSQALTLTPEGEAQRILVSGAMEAVEERFEQQLAGHDMARLREALHVLARQGDAD